MQKRNLLVVTLVVLLIPVGAYASHRFNDVPSTHTFHNEIAWLAEVGVTAGCNPPANTEFCPEDGVTRGQMAAFMQRFYNNLVPDPAGIGFTSRSANATPHAGNGVVLQLDLDIPTAGVLVLEATAEVQNLVDVDVAACGINTGGSPSVAQVDSWRTIDLTSSLVGVCATSTMIPVSAGSQIARLVLVEGEPSLRTYGATLQATYYSDYAAFGLLDGGTDQDGPRQLPEDKAATKTG